MEEDKTAALNKEFGGENGEPKVKICSVYDYLMTKTYFMSKSVGYIITGTNFVLRTLLITIVAWIGYATETKKLERTTTVVFLVQFFNTAFLMLMVNADLSEQPITFGLTGGKTGDFNMNFFKTIGNTIISTMVTNAVFPIIEFIAFFGIRSFKRLYDRSFTMDKDKTKKTAIQPYLDTYSGPVYFLHYKYSAVLNIAFVTFTYGFGMPYLFLVAGLSYTVLYFCEKTMLYYSYRLPPMYDERLSQSVLDKLQFAPIFFMAFSYWFVSSNQLYHNTDLTAVERASSTKPTGHTAGDFFNSQGWKSPAWPLLVMMIVLSLIFWFGDLINDLIARVFPQFKIGNIEINEDIDRYWVSLDEEDRKWTIEEEKYARSNLAGL